MRWFGEGPAQKGQGRELERNRKLGSPERCGGDCGSESNFDKILFDYFRLGIESGNGLTILIFHYGPQDDYVLRKQWSVMLSLRTGLRWGGWTGLAVTAGVDGG